MGRPVGHIRIMASSRVILNLEKADAVFKKAFDKKFSALKKKGAEIKDAEIEAHEAAVNAYTDYVCCQKGIYKDDYDPRLGGRLFEKGIAFDFLEAALALNEKFEEPIVEVQLTCKDELESAVPIFRNIDLSGLKIEQRHATAGRPLSQTEHEAFGTDLLLTRNAHDAQQAVDLGIAAAIMHMPPGEFVYKAEDGPVRLWFDGDAVAFGSSAELRFREEGLQAYKDLESQDFEKAVEPGPFTQILAKFSELNSRFRRGEEPFELSLLTARGHTAAARVASIARHHGIRFNGHTIFMGGAAKAPVLNAHKPHMYFDDQLSHLKDLKCPAGLVRYPTDSPMHKYQTENGATDQYDLMAEFEKSGHGHSSNDNSPKANRALIAAKPAPAA